MLKCKEVAERSSALIDGELGLFERLQMRMHLAMCEGCRRFVSQMQATNRLAKAAAGSESSGDVEKANIDAILSRLPREKQ